MPTARQTLQRKNPPEVALRRKREWDEAVQQSLASFVAMGQTISVRAVVRAARLPCGSPAGYSTTFGKNKDGTRIHADTLARLEAAISEQRNRRNAETHRSTAAKQQSTLIKRLKDEIQGATDFIVASRMSEREMKLQVAHLQDLVGRQSERVYVLSRALSDLGATEPGLVQAIRRWDTDTAVGPEEKLRASRVARAITDSILNFGQGTTALASERVTPQDTIRVVTKQPSQDSRQPSDPASGAEP